MNEHHGAAVVLIGLGTACIGFGSLILSAGVKTFFKAQEQSKVDKKFKDIVEENFESQD